MIFWISNRKENIQFTKRAPNMQTPVFDLSSPRSSQAFHKAVYDLECLLAKHRFEKAVASVAGDAPAATANGAAASGIAHPVGNTGITSTTDNGLSNG